MIRFEPGPVALLELDNPPLNLVTAELTRQLGAALDRLAADPDVRAVVVAGAGERAFCAGADLKEQQVRGGSWSTEARNVRAANRVRAFPGRHDTDSFRCARSP